MPRLRATLVTPLSWKLARFGRESATALRLWAEHAAELPARWTGVDLEGQTRRPCHMRSSPTLATIVSLPGPKASRWLGASRAPPRPPVRRTTCDSEAG